jgi:methylmalonyl-CoA/ethylmalonyl-CoA epimerase
MTTDGMPPVPLVAGSAGQAGQVGVLVLSIDAALGAYGDDQVWQTWTYGPQTVAELDYHGEAGAFVMRIALNRTTPQIELIEPISGPSIYHDWVDDHGYGLHHLGYYVDSLPSAIDEMTATGWTVLQRGYGSGADGTGGFAYFDTLAALGFIVEAIERPGARRPPESVWPPS